MARKGIFRNNVVVTGVDDATKQVSKDAWNDDKDKTGLLGFAPTTSTVTISTGALAVIDTWTVVAAETGVTGTLTNITTTDTSTEDIILLVADAGDTITVTHEAGGAGQIHTLSAATETLSENVPMLLIRRGADLYEFGGISTFAGLGDTNITTPSSGQLAIYDGTDSWDNKTLSGDATLTNGGVITIGTNAINDAKIAAHTTTKITTTNKSLLNSNIVYTDQANTFGNFAQTFTDNTLFIQNPATTFEYQFIASAILADRTVTLPLLTGNDTFVTAAFAQTLTNKTINTASNTITVVEADISDLQTYKVDSMNTNKMLGRNTAGLGTIEEIGQVSAGEITAGTETALRGFSPDDIESFVIQHAPAGVTALSGLTIDANKDWLTFDITGAGKWEAANAAGPVILNEAVSSTNPTLIPNRTQETVGIGWLSGKVVLVAGGIASLVAGNGDVLLNVRLNMNNQEIRSVENLKIGGTSIGTSATHTIGILSGVAPTTDIADHVHVYANDQSVGNAALEIRAEGGEIISLGKQALFPDGSSTLPGIGFTDASTTGISRTGSGNILVSIGATQSGIFSTSGFFAGNGASSRALIRSDVSTSTLPIYVTSDDTDTGLGRAAADQLSLIAGAFENIRLTNPAAIATGSADGNIIDVDSLGVTGNSTSFFMNHFKAGDVSVDNTFTLDSAATVYIAGAPVNAGLGTLTNRYGFWLDADDARFDGQILAANGTAALPSIAFTANPSNGIYSTGNNIIFSVNGDASFQMFNTAGSNFFGAQSSGGGIFERSANTTVPSIIPRTGQTTSGLGGLSDAPALIANSLSVLTVANLGTSGLTTDLAGGSLTNAGNDDYTLSIASTLNDTVAAVGAELYNGIKFNLTETSKAGWNTVNLMDLQVGGASVFTVADTGDVDIVGTSSTILAIGRSGANPSLTFDDSSGANQTLNLGGTNGFGGQLLITNGSATVIKLGNEGNIFNETGANVDFRIESDTDPNMFVMDAGLSMIGISTLTPETTLHIAATDGIYLGAGVAEDISLIRVDEGSVLGSAPESAWHESRNSFTYNKRLGGSVSTGPIIHFGTTATSTNVSIIANGSDENTGLGWTAADILSLISGGVAGLQLTELSNGVIPQWDTTAGITASVTQTQGNGALISAYSEISTVANVNDTVTLPSAKEGSTITIINNGANTLQIFPASGDNLGAGLNTATTIAITEMVVFKAYDTTNWRGVKQVYI